MTTAALTLPRAFPAKRARYSPGKARQQSPAFLPHQRRNRAAVGLVARRGVHAVAPGGLWVSVGVE